jgi:multiple antibiotic resistance protein
MAPRCGFATKVHQPSTINYQPFSYFYQNNQMQTGLNELLTVTFTLFAVIDILGSIPLLLSLKKKMGGIPELKATLISGGLMILFLLLGEPLLRMLGVETHSFAVAGSIVIFILGMEMVLGVELFKSEKDAKSTVMVPIAFPMIAGSGTLTTIISLKANYTQLTILIAILANLVVVYLVLKSLAYIERILGTGGMLVIRKFFGVILLAIAVKIFTSNVPGLIK